MGILITKLNRKEGNLVIRQDIEGWMQHTDKETLKNHLAGKEVYIWGAFIQGKYVKDYLEYPEWGIFVRGFCDSCNTGTYEGKEIYRFSDIRNRSNIFVFIAVGGIRQEIVEQLQEAGLESGTDYHYIYKKYVITPYSDFEDINGNRIIANSCNNSLSVEIMGYNSSVYIGKNVTLSRGASITIQTGSNASVYIGDFTHLEGQNNIAAKNNAVVKIGSKCSLDFTSIGCWCSLIIGNKVNLGTRVTIVSSLNVPITIGDDRLFSHDIQIRSGDEHTIFDLKEQKAITNIPDRYVRIGRHVWCGSCTTIMRNADIGNGCVIGTGSMVNKKFKNNTLAVGKPAKVIRERIVWDHEADLEWKDYLDRGLEGKYLFD